MSLPVGILAANLALVIAAVLAGYGL